jgi:glyoxylase-like metal-dependent hydrolase (beta-lactamase superfamily II)
MKLHTIECGNFKLDGGAMFGVVPKSLWHKVYPSDENNLCNMATRCLLIETENRLILIDVGLGNKQSEKFFSFYYRNGDLSLEKSLSEAGFKKEDITDVILTHLHFDHCGGAVERTQKDELKVAFPNSTYWVSADQWAWAKQPNLRERASYLAENIEPLEKNGRLKFISNETVFTKDILLRHFNGHTNGLMVPFIQYGSHTLVYVSDLLPTSAHIPASWVCGFDTRPLISMQERETFLQEALKNNYILLFEHDVYTECCTLRETKKGIRPDKSFKLVDL